MRVISGNRRTARCRCRSTRARPCAGRSRNLPRPRAEGGLLRRTPAVGPPALFVRARSLEHAGVVGAAGAALVVHEVKRRGAGGAAVVAQQRLRARRKLGRQRPGGRHQRVYHLRPPQNGGVPQASSRTRAGPWSCHCNTTSKSSIPKPVLHGDGRMWQFLSFSALLRIK